MSQRKRLIYAGSALLSKTAVLIVRRASVFGSRGTARAGIAKQEGAAREREHPHAPAGMAIAGGMAFNAPFRLDVATAVSSVTRTEKTGARLPTRA